MDLQQTKKTKSEVLLVCQSYVLQTLVIVVASFIWNSEKAWLGGPRAMVCRLRPLSFRINPRAGEDVAEDVTHGGDRALCVCVKEWRALHVPCLILIVGNLVEVCPVPLRL